MPTSHTVEQPAELLAFLFHRCPDVKRTKVRQWLKYGSVQVNGQSVTRSNHVLQVGDAVSIRPKDEALAARRLPSSLKIVFEDASLIVIDKPEGLLSMANATERDKTAYAMLTNYVRRGHPHDEQRVWIVHRLDRDTSGVMVFAKTEEAKHTLQAQWDTVEKRYLAVVEGCPPADQGVIESHLDEGGPYKVFSVPPSERTRHAVTNYRVLKRTPLRALVELIPGTGRRNQLRVHMADARCPIVGDKKYGARTDPAKRLGLHASFLRLTHPLTGVPLKFESPLPRRLSRLV